MSKRIRDHGQCYQLEHCFYACKLYNRFYPLNKKKENPNPNPKPKPKPKPEGVSSLHQVPLGGIGFYQCSICKEFLPELDRYVLNITTINKIFCEKCWRETYG